jgi:hypothetical protein
MLAVLFGSLVALRDGRSSWGHSVPRVDGIRLISLARDATHGTTAEHFNRGRLVDWVKLRPLLIARLRLGTFWHVPIADPRC